MVQPVEIQNLEVNNKVKDANLQSEAKKKKRNKKRTGLKAVDDDFKDNAFPRGKYVINKSIMHGIPNEEEMDEKDKDYSETLNSLRKSGEALKRVMKITDQKLKVNANLSDFCNEIENAARTIIKEDKIAAGMSNPVTLSKNECAAFYTPAIGDNFKFEQGDMVKFDFGIHVNGNMVHTAVTANSNPIYEPLRQSTIEATNAALKLAGPDALISDISAQIEEVIGSFEVTEANGNVLEVKPVKNLYGYQCEAYITDFGKTIGLVKSGGGSKGARMEAGETFCIDTYATTGNGIAMEKGNGNVYSIQPHQIQYYHPLKKGRDLMAVMRKHFNLMKFCPRTLLRHCPPEMTQNTVDSLLGMLSSSEKPVLRKFIPLYEKQGSMVSQCKHTIFVRNDFSEVFTL